MKPTSTHAPTVAPRRSSARASAPPNAASPSYGDRVGDVEASARLDADHVERVIQGAADVHPQADCVVTGLRGDAIVALLRRFAFADIGVLVGEGRRCGEQ